MLVKFFLLAYQACGLELGSDGPYVLVAPAEVPPFRADILVLPIGTSPTRHCATFLIDWPSHGALEAAGTRRAGS